MAMVTLGTVVAAMAVKSRVARGGDVDDAE